MSSKNCPISQFVRTLKEEIRLLRLALHNEQALEEQFGAEINSISNILDKISQEPSTILDVLVQLKPVVGAIVMESSQKLDIRLTMLEAMTENLSAMATTAS